MVAALWRIKAGGSMLRRSAGLSFPDTFTITATPLFNRIAVQVDESSPTVAGTTIEGEVDYCRKGGAWNAGTVFLKQYDADSYYANCFNLVEDSYYDVRVTIRLRDSTTGLVVREFTDTIAATTKNSATPQIVETKYYIDPVNGATGNAGTNPSLPGKWLNHRTWAPGDTIVIKNGDFSAAANAAQRTITGAVGTATNWIRVIPYDGSVTIASNLALNGPWTETSGGSGIWWMTIALLVGVIRDETTGYEVFAHDNLSNVSESSPGVTVGFDVADFADFAPNGPAGWFNNKTAESRLYLRTQDGLEPEADRYVGGYFTGLTLTNCSYVVIDGITTELMANVNSGGTARGGNSGLRIQSTGGSTSQNIYVKSCTFANCVPTIVASTGPDSPVKDVLFDECTISRTGFYEVFYQRVDYTEADAYYQNLGYDPIKASINDTTAAIVNTGGERVVVRSCTISGYDLYSNGGNTSAFATISSGKNVDIYWNTAEKSVVGSVDFGESSTGTVDNINSALWGNRIDHGAEPVAMSPVNAGPVWMFANYGDGYLHTPYKIGNQNDGTDRSHGFKVIANNSFGAKGFSEDDREMACLMNGGHSGVMASNNVTRGYQGTPESFWIEQNGHAGYTVESDRINSWENCLFFMKNRVTPVVPSVRWVSDYATFALADAAKSATDTAFTNCQGTYSSNGDTDPFPTGVAAGLNASITTKSVYVRGITTLAGDASGNHVELADLRIGRFPLRDPD